VALINLQANYQLTLNHNNECINEAHNILSHVIYISVVTVPDFETGQWQWFSAVVGNLGNHSQKSKHSLKQFNTIYTVCIHTSKWVYSARESSCLHAAKLSEGMPDEQRSEKWLKYTIV